MGYPSSSTLVWVNAQASFTSRVRALPSSPLPGRPAVSAALIGTPVPSMAMYSLSGSSAGGSGTSVRAPIAAAPASMTAAAARPSASACRPSRLPVSWIPARSATSPAPGVNGTAPAARAAILRSPGDIVCPAVPSSASRGRQAVPALPAVIPGAADGDRAEHRAGGLVPVGHELRLVPGSAVRPRAPVPGIGSQQPTPARDHPQLPPPQFRGNLTPPRPSDCFDRNFPGYDLITAILDAGGHVVARVKAGISLPMETGGWLPDGSRLTWLNAPSGRKEDRLPVRAAEHNAVLPGGDGQEVSETCTLITTLLDHRAAPAGAVREAYLTRWSASETTFGEDKATIAGAGDRTSGPVLRSGSPRLAVSEAWAWLTATQLVRASAAAAPGSAAA